MTITVSMPWYGAPELLPRAVESVLAQTHTDLRLVIIGDGDVPPLDGIDDPRIVVHVLPENHGTYFCQQLILEATPDEWFAPVDADDWLDPDHLARLAAVGDTAISASLWFHDSRWPKARPHAKHSPLGWHVSLFEVERLRAIGGYQPDIRVAQDTLILRLLDIGGRCHRLRYAPTYHRYRRPGSLTQGEETSHRSPMRQRQWVVDRATTVKARKLQTPEAIRSYRDGLTDPATRAALDAEVSILRARLSVAIEEAVA